MLAILKFSGKHWLRAALCWGLFALGVDSLAEAGASDADVQLAKAGAEQSAVARGVAKPAGGRGQYQVAKIVLSDLDLRALDAGAFGDHDEAAVPPR